MENRLLWKNKEGLELLPAGQLTLKDLSSRV